MKLYFLRHGQADWPNWTESDDARPLTKKGKKEMRRVAKFLAELKVNPEVILSSPLPRAIQTAEIVADELELDVTREPVLGPGFDPDNLPELIERFKGKDLMLVGHEPGMSEAIEKLTGANAKMAKAGLARVDVEDDTELRGQLVWLIPPKIIEG